MAACARSVKNERYIVRSLSAVRTPKLLTSQPGMRGMAPARRVVCVSDSFKPSSRGLAPQLT
jgi:hypothetical protein